MKKLNQKGFSAVEAILIVVIIGLVGFVGWYVYSSRNTAGEPASSSTTPPATKEETPAKTTNEVVDVDVELRKVADLDKLPESTPASFKKHMTPILEKNVEKDNCVSVYQVFKVSKFNISGGAMAESTKAGSDFSDDMDCGSGAPSLWVLAKGKWEHLTRNGTYCTSESGGLVYEEFADKCYVRSEEGKMIKNPNGSVLDAE